LFDCFLSILLLRILYPSTFHAPPRPVEPEGGGSMKGLLFNRGTPTMNGILRPALCGHREGGGALDPLLEL